jgi:flavin-dependent dehydrogenase
VTRPLVIGAGLAGSAFAIGLSRAGAPPLLVERAKETGDAICGGFLSWQTLATLDRLGLDAAALGGQHVTMLRLFAGKRILEASLPRPGMGLSRRRLDTLLLAEAERLGTAVERGVMVRRVDTGTAITSDGAAVSSDTIILGVGKHGLVSQLRPAPPKVAADPVIGLRLRINVSPTGERLVGHAVELFLFDRGYAGLVRQEDGSINLCLAVHKSRLAEAGSRPESLIAQWGEENSRLGERLASGDPVGPIDAIASVPYGWRARSTEPGLWKLGDQAACIPSLAGEGMGIALASAESAVAAWRRGEDAASWQQRFSDRLALPMGVARMAWAAAENPRWNAIAVSLLDRAPWLLDGLARATRVPA